MDLLSRVLTSMVFIALGLLAYLAWNRWHLRRLSRASVQRAPGLEQWRPGVPAILYFTTPDCAPCRTLQRPALERLKRELTDGLQVIEIDASAQTAVADHWGVLSVPTTFVLDTLGRPQTVNHGATQAKKLRRQLEELNGRSKREARKARARVQTPRPS